jgi:hypothetical protein
MPSSAGCHHKIVDRARKSAPCYAETPGGIQADLRVSKVRPRIVVPYGSRPSIGLDEMERSAALAGEPS